MSVSNKIRGIRHSALALGVVLGLMSVGTYAEDAPAAPAAQPAMPALSPEQMELMKDFQQTRQEIGALEQKLQGIEAEAYKKNPKLGKQRDGLRDSIKNAMSDKNFDAQAKYDELKALVTKIQGMKENDPERAKDIQKFREGQQAFEQRQAKAFQDPKIQKQSEKLRNDVRAAMIKVDPKAKDMFADLDAKEKHMRDLQEKAMKMHGSEQVAPAPSK
ncbi:MAG: hypothetical protein B7X37_08460 [Halothiobacillus sp. 14-55-98]|nr:MAG: hypothetical protein B7X37_08460 [Halothiobacillus sp. 14-55-98]